MAEFCNSCGRLLTEAATESEDNINESSLKNLSLLKRFIAKFEDKVAKGEIAVQAENEPRKMGKRLLIF